MQREKQRWAMFSMYAKKINGKISKYSKYRFFKKIFIAYFYEPFIESIVGKPECKKWIIND